MDITLNNQISTLTQFIESGGLSLGFSDMGRRITHIPREQFIQFELAETPYPLPLQQQAWFGLTISDPEEPQIDPMIWFIHFPLDEQGKLQLSARDDFMHQLMERLGNNLLTGDNGEKIETALQDNPYAFQPKSERLAVFHARMTHALKRPVSRFHNHAKDYFDGQLGWDQWSFIGYQGIADLAARIGQKGNSKRIANSIPFLPPSPLEVLCHCLENEVIPESLTHALTLKADSTLQQTTPNPQILTAVIRGLSQSCSEEIRNSLMLRILDHPISSRTDILAAIAGRAWECLNDVSLCRHYLERLANNEMGQDFFNGILSDLLYLPATRDAMQSIIRDPQRSEKLSGVIGEFFSSVRG
ncbi:MAG: DUF3549 family protein [Candidatus Thiodiazotropha sp. (ex Lucinoma borealis)]|nr:DUF3549 family protein [Candidatus Thiodiazotropha sp. (ex Lucinoma borealis)]